MLEVINIGLNVGSFSLKNISFNVDEGGYFMLLGESGAGKSMLLELLAGLRKPDCGKIILSGTEITHTKAHIRGIGLVFQNDAVFPHMSVERNISYALKHKGIGKQELAERIIKWAEIMSITGVLNRQPASLSGGELRRVALARTLAMEPRILLLDEPLSSLDILLKGDLLLLLKSINRSGQTIIHVTHDFNEAYALADSLAVINKGAIEQIGSPSQVFDQPASRFVAAMAGVRNFFICDQCIMVKDKYELTLEGGLKLNSGMPCYKGDFVSISETDITLAPNASAEDNIISSVVVDKFPSAEHTEIVAESAVRLYLKVPNDSISSNIIRQGQNLRLSIPSNKIRVIGSGKQKGHV